MLSFRRCVAGCLLGLITLAPPAAAEPAATIDQRESAASWQEFFMQLTDLVLQHHVDPPTRQQMLLTGLQAIRPADAPPPIGLGAEISELSAPAQYTDFFARNASLFSAEDDSDLRTRFAQGVLSGSDGRISYIPPTQLTATAQLRDNQYVGVGVAVAKTDSKQPAEFTVIIENGPAYHGGILRGDRLLEVDEVEVVDKPLEEIVQLLRGPRGTDVTVVVQQPEQPARTIKLTRDTVPFETVVGRQRDQHRQWDFSYSEDEDIAYVKIEQVLGSTAHELRQLAPKLHSAGYRALVLDLRQVSASELHHLILLADTLLPAMEIGRVVTRQGERVVQSGEEAVFPDWPTAVLISPRTSSNALWLAEAFKDRPRTKVVDQGSAPRGRAYAFTSELVRLPAGGGIEIPTALLLDRHGKPIAGRGALTERIMASEPAEAREQHVQAVPRQRREDKALASAAAWLGEQLNNQSKTPASSSRE